MTRETTLHKERQHSMVATQDHNNIVATPHGSSTKHDTNIIGYRQQYKGINCKVLVFFAARSSRYLQRTEKRSDPGMCVLWGPLTECYWQNGCSMWRMRTAVDISDRVERGLRGFYKWVAGSLVVRALD